MSDFPRWKYALVALVMLFGIVYALPNAFIPLPAVQVTANRDAPPIDQAMQQKVTAALAAQHITAGEVKVQGDHLLATFANSDVQKSGADAMKAALGDGYTVAFKLQSTVPGWLGAIGARTISVACCATRTSVTNRLRAIPCGVRALR
jgi:preprotein translocase subunit SecD